MSALAPRVRSLDIYLRQVGDCPPAPQGESPTDLILGTIQLVVKVAREFSRSNPHRLAEFVAAGNAGLVEAAFRYTNTAQPFHYFALTYIRRRIYRALRQQAEVVALSAKRYRELYQVRAAVAAFQTTYGREPHAEEIAEAIHLTPKVIRQLFAFTRSQSLDAPANDASDTPLHETIAAPKDEDSTRDIDLQALMAKALNERERAIISAHFGLDGGEPLTFEQIAEKSARANNGWGDRPLSKQAIQQYEARALRKLRAAIRSRDAFGLDAPRFNLKTSKHPVTC